MMNWQQFESVCRALSYPNDPTGSLARFITDWNIEQMKQEAAKEQPTKQEAL